MNASFLTFLSAGLCTLLVAATLAEAGGRGQLFDRMDQDGDGYPSVGCPDDQDSDADDQDSGADDQDSDADADSDTDDDSDTADDPNAAVRNQTS